MSTREDSDVETIEDQKIDEPKLYKVLLHNDDYTTMDFVVYILTRVFGKSQSDAETIMMKIHQEGVGLCGVYTYEIAETKKAQVAQYAQDEGHPLRCSVEPE